MHLDLLNHGSIIVADNVLYKGMVMSDYNKHKQRTAVTKLREFIQLVLSNKNLDAKLVEIGDGLIIAKVL